MSERLIKLNYKQIKEDGYTETWRAEAYDGIFSTTIYFSAEDKDVKIEHDDGEMGYEDKVWLDAEEIKAIYEKCLQLGMFD